jgi:hypothetical protein
MLSEYFSPIKPLYVSPNENSRSKIKCFRNLSGGGNYEKGKTKGTVGGD